MPVEHPAKAYFNNILYSSRIWLINCLFEQQFASINRLTALHLSRQATRGEHQPYNEVWNHFIVFDSRLLMHRAKW
jgi:hypothetical protein